MRRRPTSLVDAAFAAGWLTIPHLPRAVSRRLFEKGARIAVRRSEFAQLRRNLRQVVGRQLPEAGLDDLVERSVRSYARYWREAFLLPRWDRADVVARHTVTGLEHIRPVTEAGRGIVFALTHSGNWDAGAIYVLETLGIPMTTVAERLKPESLFERFRAYRESLGMEVAALTGDSVPALVKMKRQLNAGGMVTLPADRDLAANGIPVELCGRRTTMPTGPALMAMQTGAALIPLRLYFLDDGWAIGFDPEITQPAAGTLRQRVSEMTQHLANHFTDYIRGCPEDWHMFQRVWPDV